MGRGTSGAGKGGGGRAGGAKKEDDLGPIKKFDDKPKAGWDGGWEYQGDGEEQVAFMKEYSTSYDLLDSMSHEDREAFRAWTRGAFMRGQQYEGWDSMTSEEKRWTETYDKFLDQCELTHGIEVSRRATPELVLGKGKSSATLAELQAMEGSTVHSKGALSTGLAGQGLTIGSSKKPVEYKITIPKSKGSGMWVGAKRVNGWGAKQREFMVNRDSLFQVGKTVFDSARGLYVVDLKWIGRTEHDYGSKGK